MSVNLQEHYFETLRAYLAATTIGPSTLRNQGAKHVIKAARAFLADLDPNRFRGVRDEQEYLNVLDKITRELKHCLPAHAHHWGAARKSINLFMRERMGFPPDQIDSLRDGFFRQYGTTLRGLQANHQIDVQDYLAYVHDVRLADYIHPDPVQQEVLGALQTRNVVFTNADRNHAQRVLQALQIEPYFAAVVDVNAMEPYCKPSPEAFALAMKAAGETEPSRCVMIDDLPHTTRAAKSLGMYALLYGSGFSDGAADAALSDWRMLPILLNGSAR